MVYASGVYIDPMERGPRQLTLVETPTFSRRRADLLTEQEYRLLQLRLALDPGAGPVIPGGGGIRKLRWELQGRGRRGGARVIYYWARSRDVILLLLVYAKNERDDLDKDQLRTLARLVKEEFK